MSFEPPSSFDQTITNFDSETPEISCAPQISTIKMGDSEEKEQEIVEKGEKLVDKIQESTEIDSIAEDVDEKFQSSPDTQAVIEVMISEPQVPIYVTDDAKFDYSTAIENQEMVGCPNMSENTSEHLSVEATDIQEMIHSDVKEMSSPEGHVKKGEKCFERNVIEEVLEVSVNQDQYEKKENGCRRSYSRNEMESLSCVNVEEQKIMWNEIYLKMGNSLAREYEEIGVSKNKKQGGSGKKVDHITERKEKGSKKKGNTNIQGEVYNAHMEHNLIENILQEDYDGCANDVIMHPSIVEKECDEGIESGSEDEFDNIQRPAFVVEGDPDFDSGPPQDGLEYLRRVRWEAARIPKVKVAKLDKTTLTNEQTVYMPIIPDIAKCPEHLLPSKDWEDSFLADFSELRLALTRLDTFSETSKKRINVNEDALSICSAEPTLSTVLGMDVVSRASLLRNRIKSFDDKETLSRNECAWIFALCAAIDTPFDADMGASLRCLLRKCAKLRLEKTEFDDEVVMLNILVTVSGKYFGQSEA